VSALLAFCATGDRGAIGRDGHDGLRLINHAGISDGPLKPLILLLRVSRNDQHFAQCRSIRHFEGDITEARSFL
jgi:hypothetical protein